MQMLVYIQPRNDISNQRRLKLPETRFMTPTLACSFSRWSFAMVAFALSVSTLTVDADDPELDSYGGLKSVTGAKTGFFHLESIDDRNWLVTPEGHGFFGVALSHLYSGESNVACENVYGGDKDAWLSGSFDQARAMGFNCALGSATSPERNLNGFVDVEKAEALFREHNFPYAVGVILLKHPWEFVDGETLPDIFHPQYEELILSRAAATCPRYRDDPLVMGYYYGFGAFNRSDQWVNHHMSLPAGSPGRVALAEVLAGRYDNVDSFNKVYGTSLKSIDELKTTAAISYEKEYERRNYPIIRQQLDADKLADFEAIVSHMCVTLYELGHSAIRRHDSNHVIFGSFIKEWALSVDSWKLTTPYLDTVAPQHVNETISIDAVSQATGLPIVVSDEYFGFHYPGRTGSLHAGVESHDARGDIYRANMTRHLRDPNVVGVTYCACMYDQGGETLKKNNQNGFFSLTGEPRTSLIDDVMETNKRIYELATQPAEKAELNDLDRELFETWDRHTVRRRPKAR